MAAAAVGASCPQEVGVWVASAAPQLLPGSWQQPNFYLRDPVHNLPLSAPAANTRDPFPCSLEANLLLPPPSCITDRNYMS